MINEHSTKVYQQFRSSLTTNENTEGAEGKNEVFRAFLLVANAFDEFDDEFDRIFDTFQHLNLPNSWTQSPLFDWKQVRRRNECRNRFC